jgi:ABC transporter with metal-binding/Fe-S-binding domain ATP-binding protein
MRVASLFSGGKDSTYALFLAQQMGWSVKSLVTIVPERDSMMFHFPNIELARIHSEALDIPLVMQEAESREELDVLEETLGQLNIEGLVLGAIASDYQHTRINEICHRIGLRTYAPLWRRSQETVLRDEADAGFEMVIVSVSAEGLTEKWLGRRLSKENLEKFIALSRRARFNVAGEGGEYETLVLDGPNFHMRVEIEAATTRWDGKRGMYEVQRATLVDKADMGKTSLI